MPADLRQYYSSGKISYSLRTRSRAVAISRANRAACKLDDYWYHLRTQEAELPGKHLLRHGLNRPSPGQEKNPTVTSHALTLSEAVFDIPPPQGSGKT
ncbi:DUF6538 domain-containing protein [Phaeobacter inhibens]|uniref:DUF6538 domain-containing protein n=1 Tax=Phaeobacter inhibens TaxID=221822 RepID=UPI00288341AD|nr:DUF6538 domain-containing protein [Phaeobacter inhibens]